MNQRRDNIPPSNPMNELTTCLTPFLNAYNSGGGHNGNSVSHQSSMPPNSPYSQIPTGSPNFITGASLLQSVSQPSPVFSFVSLPPLSPSSSTFRDFPSAPVADFDGTDTELPPFPLTMMSNPLRASNSTLLPRKAHRPTYRDNLYGLESMIPHNSQDLTFPDELWVMVKGLKRELSSEKEGIGERKFEGDAALDEFILENINLDNLDVLGDNENLDDMEIDLERESNVHEVGSTSLDFKRRAAIDISPSGRHHRSFSMDSCFNLPPSFTNLVVGNQNAFSLCFEKGSFNASDYEILKTNSELAEIDVSEPKRAKRILANRKSAARSKEKKMQYIAMLEKKVRTLQAEAFTLSAQFEFLQRDNMMLLNHNKELKVCMGAMEQKGRLRDALNDQLNKEVERLKLATSEWSELNAKMYQQLNISQFQQPPMDPSFG